MNYFEKTFTEFKAIVAAHPTFQYGYEDRTLVNSEFTEERTIILVRSEYQIYIVRIYDPSADWTDFENNYKAGATLGAV